MIRRISINADIPDGYEATGEYRPPRKGENYLGCGGILGAFLGVLCDEMPSKIILRKKWAFPAWFKNGWWLYNCGHRWAATDVEPIHPPNIYWNSAIEATRLWDFHGETFVAPLGVERIRCVR